MEISVGKGLVNHTFVTRVYLPPAYRRISRSCCGDDMWYSCLVCGNHVHWRQDLLAQCFMIEDARYVSLCACELVPIWVEQQKFGKEEEQPLDCLCAWAAWECGAMALSLSHSFLLPFSLFFLFIIFFSFLSLSLFFLSSFFLSSLFFKQAKANTFLKQGYSFGWLKLAARRSAISPTLAILYESQECNVGVSFRVCSNTKKHQSVPLMWPQCSRASCVPKSS